MTWNGKKTGVFTVNATFPDSDMGTLASNPLDLIYDLAQLLLETGCSRDFVKRLETIQSQAAPERYAQEKWRQLR